jgi:hypothetical protein
MPNKNKSILILLFLLRPMDTRLLKILELETSKEKSKKKRRHILKLRKEKSIMYYSGSHKDDKPVTNEEKSEKQAKLNKI